MIRRSWGLSKCVAAKRAFRPDKSGGGDHLDQVLFSVNPLTGLNTSPQVHHPCLGESDKHQWARYRLFSLLPAGRLRERKGCQLDTRHLGGGFFAGFATRHHVQCTCCRPQRARSGSVESCTGHHHPVRGGSAWTSTQPCCSSHLILLHPYIVERPQ